MLRKLMDGTDDLCITSEDLLEELRKIMKTYKNNCSQVLIHTINLPMAFRYIYRLMSNAIFWLSTDVLQIGTHLFT
jgi:hypothetical protein